MGSDQMLRVMLGLMLTVLVCGVVSAQDEPPASKVNFVVLRDSNGKPIRAASVVLHPVNKSGKQARGGFELKTDNDGKTEFEGVPYGKMRVQVLAPGYQTFGDDYNINKPAMEIVIKLKKPSEQYSIYKDQEGTPKEGTPK